MKFQLFDCHETHASKDGTAEVVQQLTFIGKKEDGSIVRVHVQDIENEIYFAVPKNFENFGPVLVALDKYLLSKPHPCRQTGCPCSVGRTNEKFYGFNDEPCWEQRKHDQNAVLGGEIVYQKGCYGFEAETRPFLKIILSRSYHALSAKTFLLNYRFKGLEMNEHHQGVYECMPNAVESAFHVLNLSGFEWYSIDGVDESVTECTVTAKKVIPIKSGTHANVEPVYFSFDIETLSRTGHTTPDKHPVCVIAYETNIGKQKCYMLASPYHPDQVGEDEPDVRIFPTEYAMLEQLLKDIWEIDPDFICGFNSNHFDVPYVLTRMRLLNVPNWDQWTRLNGHRIQWQTQMSGNKGSGGMATTVLNCPGRLYLDVLKMLKADITLRLNSYTLEEAAKHYGLPPKLDVPYYEIWDHFHGPPEKRRKLRDYCKLDVRLTTAIMDGKTKMVKDVVEYSKVFHIRGRDVLDKGISFKLFRMKGSDIQGEFLRQSAYSEQQADGTTKHCSIGKDHAPLNYQGLPLEMKLRKAKKYEGGYVKEPKPSFCRRWIGTLDFNSLYPSVMRARNICHTTLVCHGENVPTHEAPNGAKYVTQDVFEGIIPRLLKKLVEQRKASKDEMKLYEDGKDPDKHDMLNSKQNALKVAANSLYGQLGAVVSKLCQMMGADAVTSYGREYILKVIDFVTTCEALKDLNPEVMYGDTDSCMVAFDAKDLEDARNGLARMANAVNTSGMLPPLLKVGKDSLAPMGIFLKKKNYCLMKVNVEAGKSAVYSIDPKGMSIKKRDFAPYIRTCGDRLLKMILLEGASNETIYAYVHACLSDLVLGKVERKELLMTKKLNHDLSEYKKPYPVHVIVAQQLIAKGFTIEAGERIHFYICATAHGKRANQVKKSDLAVAEQLAENYDLDYRSYAESFVRPFEDLLTVILGSASTKKLLNWKAYDGEKPHIQTAMTDFLGLGQTRTMVRRPQPEGAIIPSSASATTTTTTTTTTKAAATSLVKFMSWSDVDKQKNQEIQERKRQRLETEKETKKNRKKTSAVKQQSMLEWLSSDKPPG